MERKPLVEVYSPRPVSREEYHHLRTHRPNDTGKPAASDPPPRPPRAVSAVNPPSGAMSGKTEK